MLIATLRAWGNSAIHLAVSRLCLEQTWDRLVITKVTLLKLLDLHVSLLVYLCIFFFFFSGIPFYFPLEKEAETAIVLYYYYSALMYYVFVMFFFHL